MLRSQDAKLWIRLFGLLAAIALPVGVAAQGEEPLVLLNLATFGPPHSLGTWLQDALADEPFELRWPDPDEVSESEEAPACVVTWSDPGRSGEEARQMRGHLRGGAGILYVVGMTEAHLAAARSFWAPLHVNVQPAGGISGFPAWADDPLTEGLPAPGATTASCILSGRTGKALMTVAGQAVAMGFDWGERGRAVLVDQALLGDQLSTQRPPAAVRDFIVRSVRWTAQVQGAVAEPHPEPEPPPELLEPEPIEPPSSKRALLDMGATEDNWPDLEVQVVEALEDADLRLVKLRGEEPLLTSESLEDIGLLAVGSCRDFQPSEAIAVSRFYATGGRLLLVVHTGPELPTRLRTIYFNEILQDLELAVALARPQGEAEFSSHPITRGVGGRVPAPGGVQIWTYLADTLVEIAGRRAAVAQQSEASRAVLIDGGLLLPRPGEERPAGQFVTMLRRSVKWLIGDL
jgi:hypothetical protein